MDNPVPQIPTLDGCSVREVSSTEAAVIIHKYEWLGTVGRAVLCVGLFSREEELIGVACFGWPCSPESRDICGKENRDLAICLERGACAHYAPPNAPSFLISRACQIAAERGWPLVYAYADEDAGEIGAVYQACNWLYIGQGVGRTPGRLRNYYVTPEGTVLSSRSLRHKKMTHTQAVAAGWQVRHQKPKHKYVLISGNKRQKRQLLEKLRYPPLPYPKRSAVFKIGGVLAALARIADALEKIANSARAPALR